MTAATPEDDPTVLSPALMLLGVLPGGGDGWLTVDDVRAAADANHVPVSSGDDAGRLLRNLRRRGFVRCRPADDDGAQEWQVTPSGTLAAQAL